MADERSNGAQRRRQDAVCSLCPFPQFIAYWINPPSCPRRVLCESKLLTFCCSCFRDTRQACTVLGSLLFIYIFIMDMILYSHFRKANLVVDSKGGRPDEIYTPFTHLSVKALLNDQISQYIVTPSSEYFETFIKLSEMFPFITPNLVTFTHFIVGFLAGKWMSSDNLYDRRIGVIMFEFRTWLDQYDGSVYRAQPENHLKYSSDHKSWGFYFDSAADSFGGLFMCLGVFFYFMKRFGPARFHCPLPFYKSDDIQDAPLVTDSKTEAYNPWYLFWKPLTYGICLIVGGIFWTNVVQQYTELFQTPIEDPTLSALQNSYCHSYTTIFIFQMWRIIGSQSMLTYLLVLIFFDKTWEFLKGSQYVLLAMVIVLYIISVIYEKHVRSVIFP